METFENTFDPNALSATTDRWTPVRNGDIFCSPACGAKCKLADYDRAVEAASTLATMMGPGWETEVWENFGWYYVARKGGAELRFDGNEFNATIRIEPNVAISESAGHPREAMARAIAILDKEIARLTRARSSLSLMPLEVEGGANGG